MIAASSPRGNNRPALSARAIHSPVEFYRKLGEAYRASGRTAPIFDTIGHNPYSTTNAERPWTRHAGGTIGEGDYDKLMAVLTDAFGGTGQPLPGQRNVSDLVHGAGLPDDGRPGEGIALQRGRDRRADAASDYGGARPPGRATASPPTRRRS